jgi:dynein heavy chain
MLNLLTALLQKYIQRSEAVDRASFDKLLTYCMAWAIGGLFEADGRERFHKYLESKNAPLPQIAPSKVSVEKETVFDYYVDESTRQWKLWEAEVWQPPKRIAFSQLLIPTGDSTRAEYIIEKIASLPVWRHEARKEPGAQNTLLVGGPGTAKTSVIIMYCSKFDTAKMLFKRINFSSATEPANFQDSIEAEVERKQVRTFTPPG